MDDNDREAFDQFVEAHWGDRRKTLETVSVSSSIEEPVKPRRRGRPAKNK